jgi:hypothetical protein
VDIVPVHARQGMAQKGPPIYVGDACPYHQGVRRPSEVTEHKAVLSVPPKGDASSLASLSDALSDTA